jgi:hypothetical protein
MQKIICILLIQLVGICIRQKCNIYHGFCLLLNGKNKNASKIFKQQKHVSQKEKFKHLVGESNTLIQKIEI